MKLKEGMYVRYKYHNEQKIGKVDFIIYNEFADENFIGLTNNEGIFEGKILKASFDIIDLIEPGDYVNGYKVISIIETDVCGDEELTDRNIIIEQSNPLAYNRAILSDDVIENIVTKEQFDSMKYVVERNK